MPPGPPFREPPGRRFGGRDRPANRSIPATGRLVPSVAMPPGRRFPLLLTTAVERLAVAGVIAALLAGCTNGGGGGFTYPPVAATPASGPSPAPPSAPSAA